MKEFLTIGEIAQIFDMDVQTLRHYDAKGLLVPTHRDDDTRWRLYHFDQVYPLATIRYLRKLGYSLKNIQAFMDAKNEHDTTQTLREQAILLRKQCEEWMKTADIIQRNLDFIEAERPDCDQIQMRYFPQRTYIPIGDEINLFTNDLLYFYPTVGFYQGERKWFGAYIQENDPLDWSPFADRTETLPQGHYLCGYHFGSYLTIQDSIDRLCQAGAEAGYTLSPTVVTFNIIDQLTESHPDHFITGLEVQILEDDPKEFSPQSFPK